MGVNQSFYIGDTIRNGRLTGQLSLRYDRSTASMLESTQAAIPGFPTLLPSITAPAVDDMIDLGLFSPRAGVTYALDDSGRTQVRASYGLFGSQLGSGTVQAFSAASQALLIYSATDRNGNNVADANELEQLQNFAGVDPANPGAGVNFNRVDPNLKAPKTHELVFGLDRELMPQFGVSASLSWRRFTDVIWSGYDPSQQITVYPLVGVTRADYQLEGAVQGNVPGVGAYRQDTTRRPKQACRLVTAASTATVRTIRSSTSASKCRPSSGCRTAGWRASAFPAIATPSSLTATPRCRIRARPRRGPTSMAARSW